MTLHIFNPEHDIALASGLSNFTAPHAGRQLRHDLGFLPAIWAQEDDVIVVDDIEQAEHAWGRLAHRLKTVLQKDIFAEQKIFFAKQKNNFSKQNNYFAKQKFDCVQPWGWNSALRASLIRNGIDEQLLPTLQQLETIRELSHRRTAAMLLPKLRIDNTVGEAFECNQPEQVEALLSSYKQLVMKAPWSSSGRGLRFLSSDRTPFAMQAGWFRNVVASQGCVMVEPYYNKTKDFAMEFYSDGAGNVSFLGLSLFHTENGAYAGNIIATESVKQQIMARYVPVGLLKSLQEAICHETGVLFNNKYRGPFGVDMMVVAGGAVHPCVEINLRRTMGHAALALTPDDDDLTAVMRIIYSEGNYRLKIERL